MADKQKKLRSYAKGRFTRSVHAFQRSIEENVDVETLKLLAGDVESTWKDVEEKHQEYIGALEDYAEETEDAWIGDIENQHREIRLMLLKSVTKAECEVVDGKIVRLENSYREMATTIQNHITNKSAYELVEREMSLLESRLNALHIEITKSKDERRFIKSMQDYDRMHSKIIEEALVYVKGVQQVEKQNNRKIKLDKIPLPSFDGNIRLYPKFVTDFKKLVLPNIGKAEAGFTLRQCLSKEVASCLSSCTEDVDVMLKRLDDKYGDVCKLVESIVSEVRALKKVANDDSMSLIKLVDTVERGYNDLKELDLEGELCNATVTKEIENKLPADVSLMWYRKVYDPSSVIERINKFPELLKYLKIERDAREYGCMEATQSKGFRSNENNRYKENEVAVNSKGCHIHKGSTHETGQCTLYLKKNDEERVEFVKENRLCWKCLRQGHRAADCSIKDKCGVNGCERGHHASLHSAEISGVTFNTEGRTDSSLSNHCCMIVMSLSTQNSERLNVLWDTAATISLITFSAAEKLKLKPKMEVNLTLEKTGGVVENIKSSLYEVPLHTECGEREWLEVYGITKISTKINPMKWDDVLCLFDTDVSRIKKPSGEVEMLIGMNYAAYHPQKVESKGQMVMYENCFGTCIAGSHPLLRNHTEIIISNVKVNHVMGRSAARFFDTESLGINKPLLNEANSNDDSLTGGKDCTLKEFRELKLIDQGLELKDGGWHTVYPWTRDPSELPDNRQVAYAKLCAIERRLIKDPKIAKMFNDQIDEMVETKKARELPKQEIRDYRGPIHYISPHEILNPNSTSTPCRVVFNTSSKFHGHCLNEYWAKGPDFINNLLAVFIRFRENAIGLAGDIKRMYHSVRISMLDQHTHRFLWRSFKVNQAPTTYAMQVVSFGDRPAAAIAAVAIRKTALLHKDTKSMAYDTIMRNMYVDDILDSKDKMSEAVQLTEDVEELLLEGGFEMKAWTMSGNENKERSFDARNVNYATKDGDEGDEGDSTPIASVLGMKWNTKADYLFFKVKLNFSTKKRKKRTGPNLHEDELVEGVPETITRRDIIGQVNGFFDPPGFATPVTVAAKIMVRKLWIGKMKELGWDDPIPESLRQEWMEFFELLYKIETVRFPRSLKARSMGGEEPVLIVFSDASEQAYGACCYVRWRMNDGTFQSNLIVAKNKIAPVKMLTIVRLELSAAVMAARLYEFVIKECRFKFTKVYFIIDSEIVLSMIQRDSYVFRTFVGSRVGEIQTTTDTAWWFWIEGSANIADWVTKPRRPEEIGENSCWQKGPEFLERPEEEWPIKQQCHILDIPERIKVVMTTVAHAEKTSCVIDLNRFSEFKRLIRTTSRVMLAYMANPTPSLRNIATDIVTKDYERAVMWWIKECQKQFTDDDMKAKFVRLCPHKRDDGVWVVGSRVDKWVEITYNHEEPILLPYEHRFTRLYVEFVHKISHSGIATTMVKTRLRYWVINLKRMVKSVVYKCVPCRAYRRLTMNQVMGKLPIERVKPAPPWYSISIDLFGPYEVKGSVNRRIRKKVYGVLFNCLVTRAVYIDISMNYSTDAFLMVLRRFVSLRGYPSNIYSDNGSQLKAASKELKDVMKGLEWDKVVAFGVEDGVTWKFSAPDAPWQNGCAESLIKSAKKSLTHAIGKHILTVEEMQTVFFESANILNERPIGRCPTMPEEGSYLCPNDLLLGRATSKIPGGPFKEYVSDKKRFLLVQEVGNIFWRKMIRSYFPSLLVRQKWHTSERNVKIGDIVLIQDANLVRGEWRMGIVSKAEPSSEDGFVRNCSVKYKQKLPGSIFAKGFTTVERSVQRLVVLVPVDENNDEEDS